VTTKSGWSSVAAEIDRSDAHYRAGAPGPEPTGLLFAEVSLVTSAINGWKRRVGTTIFPLLEHLGLMPLRSSD
jgi:hypothetical protein